MKKKEYLVNYKLWEFGANSSQLLFQWLIHVLGNLIIIIVKLWIFSLFK